MSKDEIYVALTKLYGFTPEEIATMNPYQQLVYCRGPKTVTFSTHEEYLEFLKRKQQRG